ncbi:NO-inducible flavohemoprotein [Alteromonas gracilis]|uniref:NO-inducible flavohemoprotein n=1 Tax=Alteromonas gracilis TaxID=1479524 RepID=UPI0030CAE32E
MLQQKHINIIKSLAPILHETGPALTDHFYGRMFKHNPELKHIFNMSNQESGAQKAALFAAIAGYVQHIDDLPALQTAVERIAQKHTSFHIQPAMYDIVGYHLTETLRELTGDLFTPEVEEAWLAAYQLLAGVFVNREGDLYKQRAATTGGWIGSRDFVVKSKTRESELVISFVFEPRDNGPVIDYQAGQYLGLEVNPEGHEYTEIRQYSLSDKPNGKTYRISVKRETHGVPGVVSNYLHKNINEGDIVKLHSPAGDFFLVDRNTPVVLVSAGVGVTPMQAMLEKLSAEKYPHDVYYLHACENESQHSFAHRTRQLTQETNRHAYTWYADLHHATSANTLPGFMDFDRVKLPFGYANFYLCGPVPFMKFVKEQLLSHGVTEERIHYEVFGPHASF